MLGVSTIHVRVAVELVRVTITVVVHEFPQRLGIPPFIARIWLICMNAWNGW
jgi:hypothetical protein